MFPQVPFYTVRTAARRINPVKMLHRALITSCRCAESRIRQCHVVWIATLHAQCFPRKFNQTDNMGNGAIPHGRRSSHYDAVLFAKMNSILMSHLNIDASNFLSRGWASAGEVLTCAHLCGRCVEGVSIVRSGCLWSLSVVWAVASDPLRAYLISACRHHRTSLHLCTFLATPPIN